MSCSLLDLIFAADKIWFTKKENNYEHKDILDLRHTAKSFIGRNNIPCLQVAEHDQRGKHDRSGYAYRAEYFFSFVSLAC